MALHMRKGTYKGYTVTLIETPFGKDSLWDYRVERIDENRKWAWDSRMTGKNRWEIIDEAIFEIENHLQSLYGKEKNIC